MGNSPIVARINGILAEKNIKKQEFYEKCKITSASYSLWNTGKTYPRPKKLAQIADFLGTTTEYLQTGLGEKEKPTLENEDELSRIYEKEYYKLNEENRLLVDHLIEQLIKSQSGE